MKKNLIVFSLLLVFAIAVGGCATKGDIEAVQAREKAIAAKADVKALTAEKERIEDLLKSPDQLAEKLKLPWADSD